MSGVDWGQALASGIASGAGAVATNIEDDKKQQEWITRFQQMQAMEAKTANQKALFMDSLKPPETRKTNMTDDSGKPIVRTEEWVHGPSGENAHWNKVGETPDINFEKLNETERRNADLNQNAQDRIAMMQSLGEAKNATALARIEAANARGESDKGKYERAGVMQFIPVPDKPGETMPVISDGRGGFKPYLDENGKPQSGRKAALSATEIKAKNAADEEAKAALQEKSDAMQPPGALMRTWNNMTGNSAANTPQADAGPPQSQPPLSQFSPPAKASAHGAVVRTGTDSQGRKVAQYADGTIAPI
jgi:hypothetical protein